MDEDLVEFGHIATRGLASRAELLQSGLDDTQALIDRNVADARRIEVGDPAMPVLSGKTQPTWTPRRDVERNPRLLNTTGDVARLNGRVIGTVIRRRVLLQQR